LLNPDTVIGEPAATPEKPLGLLCAEYCVMADPPTQAGAVNVTVADALPAVAVPIVGAFGVRSGLNPAPSTPP
jgi:hypothetical protein